MYLFLLKKNKNATQPFLTSKIVETYIKNYGSYDRQSTDNYFTYKKPNSSVTSNGSS